MAGTQTVVTVRGVRNRRGQVTAVHLDTQVLVTSPGTGVPTGTVTFYLNGFAAQTIALNNGTAVLSLRPARALLKFVFVQYSGNGNVEPSVSSSQVITRRSWKTSARPLIRFFARDGGGTPSPGHPLHLAARVRSLLDRGHRHHA
jgi:hypothetical protein